MEDRGEVAENDEIKGSDREESGQGGGKRDGTEQEERNGGMSGVMAGMGVRGGVGGDKAAETFTAHYAGNLFLQITNLFAASSRRYFILIP